MELIQLSMVVTAFSSSVSTTFVLILELSATRWMICPAMRSILVFFARIRAISLPPAPACREIVMVYTLTGAFSRCHLSSCSWTIFASTSLSLICTSRV